MIINTNFSKYNQSVQVNLNTCTERNFIRLETFHPEGKPVPNSVYVHRGFYYEECYKNARSFTLNNNVHNFLVDYGRFKGGIIIFPHVNEKFSHDTTREHIENFVCQLREKYYKGSLVTMIFGKESNYWDESIFQYHLGKSFSGKYISKQDVKFGKDSLTIQVSGVTHKGLLTMGDFLKQSLKCPSVVINDFTKKNFYISK